MRLRNGPTGVLLQARPETQSKQPGGPAEFEKHHPISAYLAKGICPTGRENNRFNSSSPNKSVPAPNLKPVGTPFILDDKEKEVTPATPEFLPLRHSSQILDEIQAAASQDKSLPDS